MLDDVGRYLQGHLSEVGISHLSSVAGGKPEAIAPEDWLVIALPIGASR